MKLEHTEFISKKGSHLYDPDKFREFFIFVGTRKLVYFPMNTGTTSRHSSDQ